MVFISPTPGGGPIVQTLARFGEEIEGVGMTADIQGNIYLILRHPSDISSALVMLEAVSHRTVQLGMVDEQQADANTLAVTPDGHHLFIVMNDGRVLWYTAPFISTTIKQVAQRSGALYIICAENRT
jgi:hypothetical protein